jgi:copper chaperone
MTVQGMTCGGCVNSVKRALGNIAGVTQADVDLASGRVSVDYDDGKTSPAALKDAIEDAGYDVAG